MKISCVIPAHNESNCIERVIRGLIAVFEERGIDYELVVVDDNSYDDMPVVVDRLVKQNEKVKVVHRKSNPGFGRAVKSGIEIASGDAICIVMGDASDDAKDVVKMFEKLQEGYDIVYGSRFITGSQVYNYPFFKFIVNRISNYLVRLIFFMLDEKDITNAFKIYRANVLDSIRPLESNEFNITLELPIKADLKGFKRTSVPVNWYGRESDVTKFSISKMSKSYLRTLIKLWLLKVSITFGRKYEKED